ncbi:MAG: hypothetical protein ACOYYU_02590 [Chloroflexota bacterium]
MGKPTHNKPKLFVAIGLFMFLCSAWAMAPLWINPCVPTHLTEEEVKQFREEYGSKFITLEEQMKNDQRNREEEIPCGAQDLSTREKLRVANWEGRILNEISFIVKPLILKFELVDVGENGGAYYFKGYTFFYIPLYRVFAGGSGYMEIDRWPFKTHEGIDIGEWK